MDHSSEKVSQEYEEKQLKTTYKRKKRAPKEAGVAYRKAPQAPKRFKSPYILFSMSKMEEHRNKHGGKTKVTSIAGQIAEAWKNLSDEERSKWDEVARKDMMRYDAEKSLYTGPWQVPSKRARKDPNAPKRPMSAFLFFTQGLRQKLKAEHPSMKNTEISCLLGEHWKKATDEERRPFVERELREREQYKKDIAEWRRERHDQESAIRKRRHDMAVQYAESGFPENGWLPQQQWVTPSFAMSPQVVMTHLGMVPAFMPGMMMPAANMAMQFNVVPPTGQEPTLQGPQPTAEATSQAQYFSSFPQAYMNTMGQQQDFNQVVSCQQPDTVPQNVAGFQVNVQPDFQFGASQPKDDTFAEQASTDEV